MKIKCIDNKHAEHVLTIGKVYEAEEFEEGYRILDLDDGKGAGTLIKSRFIVVNQ